MKEQILSRGTDKWYIHIRDLWERALLAALQGGQSAPEAIKTADRVLDEFDMQWVEGE